LKHLPNYVTRAQGELGGGAVAEAANGWHSHPIVPSQKRTRASADVDLSHAASAPPPPPAKPSSPYARTVGSYVAPARAAAAAPEPEAVQGPDGNFNAQTLQTIVKAAVSKALQARASQQKQQEQAGTAVAGQSNIVWATAVPVTSNSPKSIRISAASVADAASAQTAAPVAAASDFATAGNGGASVSPAASVALVKHMAQNFESTRQEVRTAEHQEQQQAAVSDDNGGEAGNLRRERSALLNDEATAKPRDRLMEDTEAQQISELKNQVKKMKEQQRVQRLKRQVDRLKRHLRSKGYHYNRFGVPTHSLASADGAAGADTEVDTGDTGDAGQEGDDAEEGGDGDQSAQAKEETPKLPEYRKMRVCNGLGCSTQVVPQAAPPHVITHDSIKQQLEGKSLMDSLFPDPNTWESEVHLNAKGQIRADHDDPHGHLMPHNKYQHAEYPDNEGGDAHIGRSAKDTRPGLSNQLGSHLFSDAIVSAAPGFNAGTGRHTRAQEGLDWERNWETHRESKRGRVPSTARFPRNGHRVGDKIIVGDAR